MPIRRTQILALASLARQAAQSNVTTAVHEENFAFRACIDIRYASILSNAVRQPTLHGREGELLPREKKWFQM